jgi:ABC-type nitrate/sulfonate/bicarbonate transport system permease component
MAVTPTTSQSLKRWLLRHPGVTRLVVVAVTVAVWELAGRYWVDPDYLSPPSRVLLGLPSVFETEGVPTALLYALYELTVAFVLSVIIGVTVGLAVGLNRFTHKCFMPIILLLYGTPQVTILPIVVLLFGIGTGSKIVFGVSHGIFPIMILTAAGVQNIKPILLTSARSMGASRWHILRYVIFPHMIPTLFTSMRLAMTVVLLGVLLAELYVSTAGIGYFTSAFTQDFDPTKLFGLVSVLAVMAVALNETVRRAEIRFSRWRD